MLGRAVVKCYEAGDGVSPGHYAMVYQVQSSAN